MADVEITLTLPEELAEKAREAGLLTRQGLVETFQEKLDRSPKTQAFFDTMRRLHALEPMLTEEEIEAELALAKQERIAEYEAKKPADRSR